jgi:hypothetical protein
MFLLVAAAAVSALVGTVPEPPSPEPPASVMEALIGQEVTIDPEGGQEFATEFVESGDLATLVATDDVFRQVAMLFVVGDYEAAGHLAADQASAIETEFSLHPGRNTAIGLLTRSVSLGCSIALFDLWNLSNDLRSSIPLDPQSTLQAYAAGTREGLSGDIVQCRFRIAALDSLM